MRNLRILNPYQDHTRSFRTRINPSNSMNEDILSFIWRFQYFEAANLQTEDGCRVSVLKTGYRNSNSGPDFSDARIQIEGVEWGGCVEIHVKSSDWFLHTHENDQSYESVILHVVWENDKPVLRNDGTLIPTISLKGLVRLSILERYSQLINENEEIPCCDSFPEASDLLKFTMLDRVLLERLEKKSKHVITLLQDNHQDWEETAYQWLTQHFGFKLNDPAFLKLSQILPLKTIQKHRNNLTQIEAMLFGCAGLIPETSDAELADKNSDEAIYLNELQREYQFLSAKYRLKDSSMQTHEWKFLRLRPAGFPTIRLAQLAVFLAGTNGIFSSLTSASNVSELYKMFNLEQSSYWKKHFQFGKLSKSKVPAMGKDAANLLIINAAVPLMVAYSKQRQQPEMLDKVLHWLSEIPAENNRITRQWETLGMHVKNSADSQSLIEWYNHYCSEKLCLECAVGASLIRSS